MDIKLENLLLHNGLVKICDFGLSGLNGTVRRGKPHGTSAYMPPEYIAVTKHTTEYVVRCAADKWAFGIVIFAVAFADLPWDKATSNNQDYVEFKAWCGNFDIVLVHFPRCFSSVPPTTTATITSECRVQNASNKSRNLPAVYQCSNKSSCRSRC